MKKNDLLLTFMIGLMFSTTSLFSQNFPRKADEKQQSALQPEKPTIQKHLLENPDNFQYRIRALKKEYYKGEPIYLMAYVKNISETSIYGTFLAFHDIDVNKVEIKYCHRKDYHHEDEGKWENVNLTDYGKLIDFPGEGVSHEAKGWSTFDIQPGEETIVFPNPIFLNLYYDMTRGGYYRIRMGRYRVSPRHPFTTPLYSNTIIIYIAPVDFVPLNMEEGKEREHLENYWRHEVLDKLAKPEFESPPPEKTEPIKEDQTAEKSEAAEE